jgi:type IV secretory pathway VirB10-like protein
MTKLKLGRLLFSTIVALATIGFFCGTLKARKFMTNEIKLMTQNPDKNSKDKEIKLPDNVQKQVEKMEKDMAKKAQQKRADEFEREMAKKTPEEREEKEKEIKRLKETKYASETRSEEELQKEDERAIRILDELSTQEKK